MIYRNAEVKGLLRSFTLYVTVIINILKYNIFLNKPTHSHDVRHGKNQRRLFSLALVPNM